MDLRVLPRGSLAPGILKSGDENFSRKDENNSTGYLDSFAAQCHNTQIDQPELIHGTKYSKPCYNW